MQDFGFNNVEQRIREYQSKGWEITEIGETMFLFETPGKNGSEYGRPYYSNLEELMPMEWYVETQPESDTQAEYFSRLYLTFWKGKTKREIVS